MPQIPTRQDLGRIRVNGSASPASINPNVALDIGRAGAAMDEAMRHVAGAFASLGEKQQQMDDATWLAQAKIDTLTADDSIRRNTELNAGEDGSGYEQAPVQLKGTVDTIKQRPGGSAKARQEYDIWSAEQGYQTGRWAANSAQNRLKNSTVNRLDSRLDTLRGLSSANPERADEYLKAYEEEVNGYVGSAISPADAAERIRTARSSIGKESIISRAIAKPSDFGKALKGLQGAGETRPQTSAGVEESTLSFLRQEEGFTPRAKWDYQQHSNGYGTRARFKGEQISRAEAETRLKDETQKVSDYIDQNVTVPLSPQQRTALISFGFNLGVDDIGKLLPDINAGNFDKAAERMLDFHNAGGKPNEVLIGRRQREAAMFRNASGAEPATRAQSIDVSKLPKVDGTIQPSEIAQLAPEDRIAATRQIAPYLQVDMADRMQRAVASIGAKGSQNIITPQEIDDSAPLIGAKNAAGFKEDLINAKLAYDTGVEAKAMTHNELLAKLRDLVPTGKIEDLSDAERRRFDMWRSVSNEIDKQIKADPLRYVSMENESGRQALKLMAGADPGRDGLPYRERAFDTLIELQKREGVADGDIRLMSKQDAEQIVDRFMTAKGGPAAMQVLEGLQQTFGKHFDRLWGQLVDSGLPRDFLTLSTATRAGQEALVKSHGLERAMSEGKETKKDLLLEAAGAKRLELNQAISNRVGDFMAAIQGGVNSQRLQEAYRSGIERVALYHMTQGKSLNDAVNAAVSQLYGDNLKVSGGIIMPSTVYDSDGISILQTLSTRKYDMVEPIEQMIVDNIRVTNKYPKGYEHRRYINNIKSSGRFITTENLDGVYLLDEAGDNVMAAAPEGLAPVTYRWDQISALAKQSPRFRRELRSLFGGE